MLETQESFSIYCDDKFVFADFNETGETKMFLEFNSAWSFMFSFHALSMKNFWLMRSINWELFWQTKKKALKARKKSQYKQGFRPSRWIELIHLVNNKNCTMDSRFPFLFTFCLFPQSFLAVWYLWKLLFIWRRKKISCDFPCFL